MPKPPVRSRSANVTERTFYPPLLDIIKEKGGSGVQEVQYNSAPDIQFTFLDSTWLLSVKIGESVGTLKSAFLQYLRHKEESGLEHGILLMLPETVRRVPPNEQAINEAIRTGTVSALIDANTVQEEVRSRTFAELLDILRFEIRPRIEQGVSSYYSLDSVIALLREQVTDVMSELTISERAMLKVITSWNLLSGLSRLKPQDARQAARFLAAYIVLSQVMFLRLFASSWPEVVSDIRPANRTRLRKAFKAVLDINYRPIFELDVLDSVPEQYLRDTYDLIWGLKIEKVRYELPGRVFHELMPPDIRKLLAAFYTRPQAAELLANLVIRSSHDTVFDPACGSGTILTAAYRAKLNQHYSAGKLSIPHREYCEQEIFGADVMPFAVHLTCANLAAMDVSQKIDRTQILQGDSLEVVPEQSYEGGVHFQYGLYTTPAHATTSAGTKYDLVLHSESMDAILMNPPFTKVERGIRNYVDMEKFRPSAGGEVGLWAHFIFLADLFLKPSGTFGAVIPINILRGRESSLVRRFIFTHWQPKYIVKATRNYGFSEWAEYRDILLVCEKRMPGERDEVKFCLVKKDLTQLNGSDVRAVSAALKDSTKLRSAMVDIDTHSLQSVMRRFPNMMWFCGSSDFRNRDALVNFCQKLNGKLVSYPASYFREGYRPVPKGVSGFLFLTRATGAARVEESFLRFTTDHKKSITAYSPLGAEYTVERSA